MVNSSEFAARLHKIMEFYGLSATAFSDRLGVNRSTTSHLLSGRNKPSLEVVMKILDEFPEVSLYWLMNGKGSFPTSSEQSKSTAPSPPSSPKEYSNFESIDTKKGEKVLERVILCFTDGSFHTYRPE